MNLLLLLWLATDVNEAALVKQIAESGRVAVLAEPVSERVAPRRMIAPGPPPVLSFRLLEGKARHRYGDLDLVLDDAGH